MNDRNPIFFDTESYRNFGSLKLPQNRNQNSDYTDTETQIKEVLLTKFSILPFLL